MIDLPTGASNRSSLLTRDALTRWESHHGHVPHGAFVLLRTGWAQFHDQPDKFLGNFMGESKQVFPGESTLLVSHDRESHIRVSYLSSSILSLDLQGKENVT